MAAYSLADGSEQWMHALSVVEEPPGGGTPSLFLDADATPIVDRIESGDVVYVSSYPGGVFALDAGDGTVVWVNSQALGVTALSLWRQPAPRATGDRSAIQPEKKILFASSGFTGLWALDPSTGRVLWKLEKPPEAAVSAPADVAGAILVASTQGGIFLLSPLDGMVIDGIGTGGIAMRPAALGVHAYVLSNAGVFYGLVVHPPAAPAWSSASPNGFTGRRRW